MARTLQDKFLLALIARGEKEVKRLTACIVVSRAAGGFYYLGRAGSVRIGKTKANTIPISKRIKDELLAEEAKINA